MCVGGGGSEYAGEDKGENRPSTGETDADPCSIYTAIDSPRSVSVIRPQHPLAVSRTGPQVVGGPCQGLVCGSALISVQPSSD